MSATRPWNWGGTMPQATDQFDWNNFTNRSQMYSSQAQDPASAIASGLPPQSPAATIANNLPPQNGLPSSWGGGAASTPHPAAAQSGAPPASGSSSAANNPFGYKTGNWQLGQNQYQYAVPGDFSANTNLYQHGYDPNADRSRIAFAGGSGQQTNFDRVYGWTNELAKQNGFGDISQAPTQFQQWAMGSALGRLHTDTQKSGGNWADTGFAGYDKYLAQAGAAGQPPTAGTPPPPQGVPPQPPAGTPGGAQPPPQQQQSGAPPPGAGPPPQAQAQTQGQPPPGTPPGSGGNLSGFAGLYNTANPDQVTNQYLRDHGIDPLNHSGFGGFAAALMKKLVPVLMQNSFGQDGKQNLDTMANPAAMLNSIFNNGQGLGANLRGFAANAYQQGQGNPDLMNGTFADTANRFSQLNALSTFGDNPYQAKAEQQGLDDWLSTVKQQQSDYANGRGPINNQTLSQYINEHARRYVGGGYS